MYLSLNCALLNAGRLFCTVGVHPTRCKVCHVFQFLSAYCSLCFDLNIFTVKFYPHLGNYWVVIKEFEESGDPERHFQSLLLLAKEGVEKGKV